jgi:histidinol dehydrogenase
MLRMMPLLLDLINEYGPEHFIVCTANDDFYIDEIENAVQFIGNYTPESAGIMHGKIILTNHQ